LAHMDRPYGLAGFPLLGQLLVFLGLALISWGIFTAISIALIQPLFGVDLTADPALLNALDNPQVVSAKKFLVLLNSIGLFILPVFLFLRWRGDALADWLQFRAPKKSANLLLVPVLLVASTPWMNLLLEWSSQLPFPDFLAGLEAWIHQSEADTEANIRAMLTMQGPGELAMGLLLVAVLPAIGEELFFRGTIQRLCQSRWASPHVAIWFTAVLFSVAHLQFLGFVSRVLLGAGLGYSYYWSRSLWVPILGHFAYNATAVIIYYGMGNGSISDSWNTVGANGGWEVWLVAISLLVVPVLLWLVHRINRDAPDAENDAHVPLPTD
ncbi:MAG: CPBP family intramembrane glutamic endopeptidase, partial [Bacteroidota bacterium]